MEDLKGRVAVVTGAASGIGRALTESFLEAGMKVVMAGINRERLMTARQHMPADDDHVLVVPTDVSKPDQVNTLARETLQQFGAVHVLCNNAGVGDSGRSSWEIPPQEWRWVFDVNVMGVIHCIHEFLPIMLAQDTEGHIVNTASTSGLVMNTYAVPYGASKHAVVALSESLHLELLERKSKVKVSVLCPGTVNTDILGSSQRNRPAAVPMPETSPQEALLKQAYKIYLERGLDPAEVARQVLAAIGAECFYIITHDYSAAIETRMQNILGGRNPLPPPPNHRFLAIVQELMHK